MQYNNLGKTGMKVSNVPAPAVRPRRRSNHPTISYM